MVSRILISSPSSSSGKTTITCALLKILKDKRKISAFKIGPDYIDPLFHSKILNIQTGNLDLFFNTKAEMQKIFEFETEKSDFALIEGAMGFYDGLGGVSEKASAFDCANALDCPVIFVVNTKGKSLSLCAEINGFLNFRENTKIVGVILNQCSKSLFETLKSKIESKCKIEVLGYLESNPDFAIESRHLGLITPDAVLNLNEKIQKIADSVSKSVNIEKIIQIADSVSSPKKIKIETQKKEKIVRIAVARDDAFCFYYKENLELLESFGAELCFFSPLKNEIVPANCSALYIGGGYPELFWNELLQNRVTSISIRKFARKGTPIFAECGGFLYLQMLGLLNGAFENKKKLVRFGYIELESQLDNFLFKKGEKIKGHEFHYFDTTNNGTDFIATKYSGKSWNCIQVTNAIEETEKKSCQKTEIFEKNIIAGFPHFYFPSNPKVAERFVESALFYESMKSISGCSSCSSCSNCGGCGGCH